MNPEVLAIIKREVANLEKKYGEGVVFRMSSEELVEKRKSLQSIPTGSYSLDEATGVGGIPLGRVTEIAGFESSGKTSLALKVIANAQRKNLVCGIVDSENSLDLSWAKRLGVNIDDLLVAQPSGGEECIDIAKALIKTGQVRVIVMDSVAAMTPKVVMESETNQKHIAQIARMMSEELPKVQPMVLENDVALIFTNQMRDSLSFGYGPSTTTVGGHALRFYASLRIECKKSSKDETGQWTKTKCIKNKVGVPFLEGRFFINFTRGFDPSREIFETAKDKKILKAGGAYFKLADEELNKQFGSVMGSQGVLEKLRTDENYRKALLSLIHSSGGFLVGSVVAQEEDFEE